MEIVSKETVDKLVAGAESATKVAVGTANELTTEAINLFLVDSILSILKFAAVFIVFMIVKKYIDVMIEVTKEDKDKNLYKAFKTCALIASIVFFTGQSFPHIQEIAKALVAPKIFLMEKGATLYKTLK